MVELRVPPGRAGRLWLLHRLGVARRGADLLGQKLRILHDEERRRALRARHTEEQWERECRAAETWLLRAGLLDGQRVVRLGTPQPGVEVEVRWTDVMGTRYPDGATCRLPALELDPTTATAAGGPAQAQARDAVGRAVAAAVQHAVARNAVQIVAAEKAVTQRRLRAIEDRWIPRLERALGRVDVELEEFERSDGVRLRWAASHREHVEHEDQEEAVP